MSLRTRLVGAAAIAVALSVTGVTSLSYTIVSSEIRGDLDAQLVRQVNQVRPQAVSTDSSGVPQVRIDLGFGERTGLVQVVDQSGRTSTAMLPNGEASTPLPVSRSDRRIAADGGNAFRDVDVAGTHARMLTSNVLPGLAVQVALPSSGVADQLRDVRAALILLEAAGLLLAAFLAYLVARAALSPLAQLTGTVEEMTLTQDLSRRVSLRRKDELGRLADRFDVLLAALERSVTSQRQLMADASHELRTPIASMKTNVELLRHVDAFDEAERAELVNEVVDQLDELTRLVSDVVELAKGSEPSLVVEHVHFDDLVERTLDRARRNWPHTRFDAEIDAVGIQGVPARLERMVMNLLDNAAKFSQDTPDPVVAVRLSSTGLVVEDSGPGISPEAISQVFDRFYRSDEARSLPGSGLGLAIVKQVVDSHGGTISLENRREGGLRAVVSMPVVGADEPELVGAAEQ